jgi:magnesium-transporting ATPase (P-type)
MSGLLFLTSKLKAAARSTIGTLTKADVACSMITGDHIHTAIAIAEECGILQKPMAGDLMLIVDEEESTGKTVIIDAFHDKVLDMRLEKILDMASISCNPSSIPYNCCDSLFCITTKATEVRTHAVPLVQISITMRGLLSALRNYPPHVVNSLIRYARVFARMKPEHKKHIVEEIMLTHEWDQYAGVLDTVSNDMSNLYYS